MMNQRLLEKWNVDESWTLFLDRDGVINQETLENYITSPAKFIFLEDVLVALKSLSSTFNRVIIVTNQQGVGKGLMSENDLNTVNSFMIEEVEKVGARIDAVYCATELRGTVNGLRKPARGLADLAKSDYPELNYEKSIMVGNSESDIVFGKNLGMKTVFIGESQAHDALLTYPSLFKFAEAL